MKGSDSSLALLALTSLVLPVGANTAVWLWEGDETSGSMVAGEGCPVVVEIELLTFHIPSFPMEDRDEGNKDYFASVTAEYSLYNPSEEEITMELIFPFGKRPSYYYEWELGSSPKFPTTSLPGMRSWTTPFATLQPLDIPRWYPMIPLARSVTAIGRIPFSVRTYR